MFTFLEMLALVESESSFGAYVCHRKPGGSIAVSDLVVVVLLQDSTHQVAVTETTNQAITQPNISKLRAVRALPIASSTNVIILKRARVLQACKHRTELVRCFTLLLRPCIKLFSGHERIVLFSWVIPQTLDDVWEKGGRVVFPGVRRSTPRPMPGPEQYVKMLVGGARQ